MFLLVPLFFLGVSALFDKDTKGYKVLGSFFIIAFFLILSYLLYWCIYLNGREQCVQCMMERERKRLALHDLPDDMVFLKESLESLKERVTELADHTGMTLKDGLSAGDGGNEEVETELETDGPKTEEDSEQGPGVPSDILGRAAAKGLGEDEEPEEAYNDELIARENYMKYYGEA